MKSAKISEKLEPKSVDEFARDSRTGFLWTNRNVVDIENYRRHKDWDTWWHIYTYDQGIKRMAVDVEFVAHLGHRGEAITGYGIVGRV